MLDIGDNSDDSVEHQIERVYLVIFKVVSPTPLHCVVPPSVFGNEDL